METKKKKKKEDEAVRDGQRSVTEPEQSSLYPWKQEELGNWLCRHFIPIKNQTSLKETWLL